MPANYEFPLQVPLSAGEINHPRKAVISYLPEKAVIIKWCAGC